MARFILIVLLVVVASLTYSESGTSKMRWIMKCKGGPYDTWIEQPTGCEPTCESANTECKSPPSYSSCRCEIGTVRRADGRCVEPFDCVDTSTARIEQSAEPCNGGIYDKWENNTFPCELTCDRLLNDKPCTKTGLVDACRCQSSTARGPGGECIPLSSC